jgi:hypothetical protein
MPPKTRDIRRDDTLRRQNSSGRISGKAISSLLRYSMGKPSRDESLPRNLLKQLPVLRQIIPGNKIGQGVQHQPDLAR